MESSGCLVVTLMGKLSMEVYPNPPLHRDKRGDLSLEITARCVFVEVTLLGPVL